MFKAQAIITKKGVKITIPLNNDLKELLEATTKILEEIKAERAEALNKKQWH